MKHGCHFLSISIKQFMFHVLIAFVFCINVSIISLLWIKHNSNREEASYDDNAITVSDTGRQKGSVSKSTLLTKYLAEIRKYPILSFEEEQSLARRYYDEGDEEAATKLVSSIFVWLYEWHSNIILSVQRFRFDSTRQYRTFTSFAKI